MPVKEDWEGSSIFNNPLSYNVQELRKCLWLFQEPHLTLGSHTFYTLHEKNFLLATKEEVIIQNIKVRKTTKFAIKLRQVWPDFQIENIFSLQISRYRICWPFWRFLDPEISPFLRFLDPETSPFLQFLDPEIYLSIFYDWILEKDI